LITDHFKVGNAACMKLGTPETIQDEDEVENNEEDVVIIEEKEELAETEFLDLSREDCNNNVINTAQEATRRSTRKNRDATMQAIITTIFKGPRREEIDTGPDMCEIREDQFDSESEYEE
jgi:hypothetical protein